MQESLSLQGVKEVLSYQQQYHPAHVLLKESVRRGELGQVRYIYSNRLNLGRVRQEENILWSLPHLEQSHRQTKPEALIASLDLKQSVAVFPGDTNLSLTCSKSSGR